MDLQKVRWGILSTARIGINSVIPALLQGKHSEIAAIASRDSEKARQAAEQFNIPKYYGSYQELVDDPEIDAIYNPLPNHLHVPWSEKAIRAGKHVLCEKPLSGKLGETLHLVEIAQMHPSIKVMEAFMYRFHPQWTLVRQMIADGKIGELRSVVSRFSYFNENPDDYRNNPEFGGGGLLDIGCYNISIARWLFGKEPEKVSGSIDPDPHFGVDRLASGLLTFDKGTSVFTCGTQMFPDQEAVITGTSGQIRLSKPFNPHPAKPAVIEFENAHGRKNIETEPADQYMLMTEAFSLSILNDTAVPTPLQDAVDNMKVIDAVIRSAETGRSVFSS